MKSATTFSTWPAWLGLCGGLALAACQYLIYVYAPVESTMGVVQKIFYSHLPLAWWALVSGGVACVAGIAYLRTRSARWDHLAYAGAELAFVLSTLALMTGSIWARHSWGVWWTWDPRLTTALVLWFLYAGYLVLRHLDLPAPRRAVLGSVVGIVAFLDVPLVFFSARFWRSIHPAVFASEQGGLEPEMRLAAIASVLAFGLVWASLLVLRARAAALDARSATLAARVMDEA
ncbi:MAG TPA: cytochrome c biogenesis protein CcsA [Candidatus Avidesulfovibrio excrementigallinarum]|nr:cytochrome c biogenesis protein CcsA [Candidatus Avidesulfovibrio excrementigallinarum]